MGISLEGWDLPHHSCWPTAISRGLIAEGLEDFSVDVAVRQFSGFVVVVLVV